MINLTIDGKKVAVPAGSTILEAARDIGISIPTLCYHEALKPYGACRLCSVEVFKGKNSFITPSCMYPVEEGIEVKTDTERIKQGRKIIMELLLARCPESQTIREKAGELGVTTTRFFPKNDDCILCGLCVRACAELSGIRAISMTDRGAHKEVMSTLNIFSSVCVSCGICATICPTGAIQKIEKEPKESIHRWEDRFANRQCWLCGSHSFEPEFLKDYSQLIAENPK